jgi:hypothetical protein
MSTSTQTKSYTQPQENWRQQYDAVTNNDVIDAYLKGKQAGKDESKIAMIKLFEHNLRMAQESAERLYDGLVSMGFAIKSIHLKADTLTNFMALVVADLNDYASEKFLDAISKGRELKMEKDAQDFNLNFYFTYQADTLNERSLDSDGYFLKYDGHQ